MSDPLEMYVQDKVPVVGDDYWDVQRAALQEVLKLSDESVRPAETQIEKRYRKAREAVQREWEEAIQKIETRLRESHAAAEREFDDQLDRIKTLHESDLNTLEVNTRVARDRVVGEANEIGAQAKKELDDKVWMAETVARSSQEAVRDEFRKAQKEVASARKSLASRREHAAWLVELYGYKPGDLSRPTDGEPAEPQESAIPLQEQFAILEEQIEKLEVMRLPRLFIGIRPHLLMFVLCVAVIGVMVLINLLQVPYWPPLAVSAPLAVIVISIAAVVTGKALKRKAQVQVQAIHESVLSLSAEVLRAFDQQLVRAKEKMQKDEAGVVEARQQEIQSAREEFQSAVAAAETKRDSSLQQIDEACAKLRSEINSRRDNGLAQIDAERQKRFDELRERHDRDAAAVRERYQRREQDCRKEYESARAALGRRWDEGLACVQRLLDKTEQLGADALQAWSEEYFSRWRPPGDFASVIPLGRWHVDLTKLAAGVRERAAFLADGSAAISTPALLKLPERCSLLLQYDRVGRRQAIDALRAVMLRLLTSLPPGRVHFTIIDPVGLGESFAGFMHLADYEDALVGGRIWTETEHIEQRLADLTNHMENVIQKYLRNEFETINAYNTQAGELAEPYRFLVVADFPVNFNDEACRRLSSIVSSGARCGVYSLIAHDRRQETPVGMEIEDLQAGSVHLVYENDRFIYRDDLLQRFPLTVDTPPSEETLTQVMHAVGQRARDSLRVEVPFETIAPPAEKAWTRNSSENLCVPMGRRGAVRLQELRLGQGVAQHVLIAGKTGSGKSTLLHVIVTNLALWYSPEEVEFYLVDFKQGVEFKTYVTHALPHARAIAIESDREFGLSVLQRLDAEMTRRGELFRHQGVQDLASYRQSSGARLPRTLLIVDEFQVFFAEDDKLSQDAAVLLDRLVRQGRAFGLHVLLGSQTLGGTSGLARSTMGQMAVRIALQCSETDSQLILDDSNVAARLLSRPGEAIYNDAGGLVEGNNPFQTSWLPDGQRDAYLDFIENLTRERLGRRDPPIVFEGNAPADVARNRQLSQLLETPDWPAFPVSPQIWLGEAVAIKDPTAVTFRRQSGANLFMVGQRDDAALAMMAMAMVSLGAQYRPQDASFVVLDGRPGDAAHADCLKQVADALPHATRMVEWRDVADAINDLAIETRRRQEADETDAPAIYVIILGLQRYRMLRRREDDFGFSMDEGSESAAPDKLFAELLREGPSVGVHVLTWADTPASLDRTFDRSSMGTFDNRVLFQISAADSSNLIDSPAANKLGFYRALLYSEEQGIGEKFRPYAIPEAGWLEQVRSHFNRKLSPPDGAPASS